MDFNSLRNNRNNSLKDLTSKVENLNGGGKGRDERIWKPGFDKQEGRGYAVVRFLPPQDGGDSFQRVYFHTFKGPGGLYFENSRKTIDQKEDDPVATSNRLYWSKGEDEGDESLKNVARNHKRKIKYYANVYIIKDSSNPENEGQVKVMEFGQQMFKKVQDAIKPEFEDDKPFDPFDMWSGADFIIKATANTIKQNGKEIVVPNYEKSIFDRQNELFAGDDDKKKEVYEQTHGLSEFCKIKEFDELAKRFEKVVGEAYNALETGNTAQESQIDKLTREAEEQTKQDMGSTDQEPEQQGHVSGADNSDDDSDDDDIFAKIRNGDL